MWLLLDQIVQVVYFFNPVAWLARARLEDARERACDELVLAQRIVPPRAYAAALLEVLRLDLQGAGAPSMASSKRRIAMRLTAILDHSSRPARAAVLAAALIITGALFLLPLAGAGENASGSASPIPNPGAPAAQPPASPAHPSSEARSLQRPAVELTNPVPGARVTLGWGKARHPRTGEVFHHDGIDLAAPSGTPVLAAADGTVVHAVVDHGSDPRGRWLTLRHAGGTVTYYGHLHQINVAVSQEVRRGDTIATVGSTGYSTGPHLHFEVRGEDGEATDPAQSIDFNPR
jgi:murein DD-endopeptidase MepM/ murein hydrolase activator NlpD